MVDKNDNYESNNDEFHFSPESQEQLDAAAFSASDEKSNKAAEVFGNVDRSKILSVIAGIILFFAIYKLGSLFLGEEFGKKSPPPIIKPELAMPKPVPLAPLMTNPAPILPQKPEVDEQQQNQINVLQNQVSTLSSNISSLQDNLNNLTQQVTSLTTQVQKQTEALEKVTIRPQKTIKKVVQKKTKLKRKSLTIRAMVPGRAWLVDSDGNNLSVTVGDSIIGYGKIIRIDPIRGRVATSSGAIIKYR